MTEEPKVTIENEGVTVNHWFKKAFYRKDGMKLTIIPKRARAMAGAGLFLAYSAYLFQGPPEPKPPMRGQIPLATEPSPENSSDIPEKKALTANPGKTKSIKGRRKPRPAMRYSGPELVTRPRIPIPPGTLAKAKLISGGSNGPVRAELTESVASRGETLLEPGLLLLGTGSSTEERLFIRFNRLVFKDGTFQSVDAQAFDADDKTAGLKGSLLGNRAMKLAGSIGLNFVGGLSDGLQDTQTQNGTAFRPSTLKNALLNGASFATVDEARDQMTQLRNQQPVIQVEAGKEIIISFDDAGS